MSYIIQHSANLDILILPTLLKPASSNRILSDKVDKPIACIIFKAACLEKKDDNENDFELFFHNCVCKARRFLAADNQTQKSIIDLNIAGPLSGKRLSKAKSLKKNNLINSCIILNVIG